MDHPIVLTKVLAALNSKPLSKRNPKASASNYVKVSKKHHLEVVEALSAK